MFKLIQILRENLSIKKFLNKFIVNNRLVIIIRYHDPWKQNVY